MLPFDDSILLSYINTKLRDGGGSLADVCEELDASCEEVEERLSCIGYRYDASARRFVAEGGKA